MRGVCRRIGILALVLMVAFQPAVGGAMAAPSDDPCTMDVGDWWGIFTDPMGKLPAEECADQKQKHSDVYASGLSTYGASENMITLSENHQQAARDTVWCNAKATAIEEMKNGSNRTETYAAVNETIDKRYVTIQKNLLNSWNNTALTAYYLINSSRQEGLQGAFDSNTGVIFVDTASASGSAYFEPDRIPDSNRPIRDVANKTLVNGSTAYYERLGYTGSNGYKWGLDPFLGGGHYIWDSRWDQMWSPKPEQGTAEAPADKDQATYIIEEGPWASAWNQTIDEHDYARANSKAFVDGLYDTYNVSEFDDVNASEVHSACSLSTYSTDANSTGYYGHAQSALSLLGLNGSVNASMTVRYDPADLTGDRYADTVGAVAFETNGTGDGAFVAPGDEILVDVTGDYGNVTNVTVEVMDTDGNALGNVTLSESSTGTWAYDLTSVNDTISDGERIRLNYTAETDGGNTSSLSNLELVVDGPAGRRGELMTGQVMTDWRPTSTNGSLVVDKWYNTTDATSPVYMLDQRSTNRTVTVDMGGEFVIVEMTDIPSSESINETTLEDENAVTANGSTTLEEMENVLKWRDRWTQNHDSAGGGGGGGFNWPNFNFGTATLAFIAIAGGGLLILTRG